MKWIWVATALVFSHQALAVTIDGDSILRLIQADETYQKILNSSDPEAEIKSLIEDNLLVALYQRESYVKEFEREVTEMSERAKADPNFRGNPLENESYQNILRLAHAAQILSDEIKEAYKRLLDTAADRSLDAATSRQAREAVTAIDHFISQLSAADKTQLHELILELQQLREKVPILDPTFYESGEDYRDLLIQVRSTRDAIQVKAQKSRGKHSSRLETLLREERRSEQPRPPMTMIAASTGTGGNVTGAEFPDGVWALTFDDGPDREYSIPLMNALSAHRDKVNPKGAPGTFFWLAGKVPHEPAVVQAGLQGGFSLNCHSWTHANLKYASDEVRKKEIIQAVELERQAFGRDFHFYRCPGGSCWAPPVPKVRAMIASLGLVHAYWTIDSLDWMLRDPQQTYDLVTKQMIIQKRGIVLMHDIHPFSLEAAKMILQWIKEQNDSGSAHIQLYTLDDAVTMHNSLAGSRAEQKSN